GLEVNRVEAHVVQLERARRAHRHRARDGPAIVATGGEVMALDLDLLRGPRPRLGQRPVLEGGAAPRDDEVIHRDVQGSALPGPLEEIRDVESVAKSHDAYRR